MALDVEASSSGDLTSKRNKAIIYAFCKRLSFDPENFFSESAGSCDVTNLVSNFFQSSAKDISFSKDQDECNFSNEEAQKYPNVIRWMDYIQNKEDFGGAFDMIMVNKLPFEHFTAAPADGKASVDSSKVIEGAVVKDATESAKKSTEEKKKPSEKESSDKEIEFSIAILNIQVGLIRKAWKHPSADSLLVEEIDLGDGNLRQVVSGLAKYYSPDDLINRLVVLITNVKAGKLRDVMSSGLVLCASNQENSTVEPLIPPEGAKIGERVSFLGFEGKPEDVLNPKKKQLEKITPHLYTDEKGVATYKGVSFMTSAGPCTSSIANATIK